MICIFLCDVGVAGGRSCGSGRRRRGGRRRIIIIFLFMTIFFVMALNIVYFFNGDNIINDLVNLVLELMHTIKEVLEVRM